MRKNAKKFTKTFISFLLCFSLILPLTQNFLSAYTNGMGLGNLVFNERREIAQGVFLDTWQGRADTGKPKRGYSLTFNPKDSDAMVVTSYGDSINSRKTLTKMISGAESQGYSVIGGINGDFYHLVNGVPIGMVMKNGRIISNPGANSSAIGFKEDGSVVIGHPEVKIEALLDYTQFVIAHINKAQGDWGPYMYTSDYGPSTGSTEPSLEVVIDLSYGDTLPGKMMIGVVSAIRADAKSTPVGKNQVVLSARNGKYGYTGLSQLKVGDAIGITLSFKDPKWDDVKEAIGGSNILISGGQINASLSSTNINPTTAIGVKANGTVIFLEIDGRNDSHSIGMTSADAARFLFDQGCVDAIQLDGGGSSTIAARLPGNKTPSILNKPSDGSERANSNGLLLISKQGVKISKGEAAQTTDAKLLHIYPGKTAVLPGAGLTYKVTATNDYFFPVTLPQDTAWKATGGSFEAGGQYTAPNQTGDYTITVSGALSTGSAQVMVISKDSITQIIPSKASITALPGASQTVNVEARANGLSVISKNSHYKWEVEGNIGTITQDGVFTAQSGGDDKGKIKVSLGSAAALIDVTIAQPPVVIDEFENTSGWSSTGVRAASHQVSVVTSPDMAVFGNKMLKIDYDFRLAPGIENGVAGAYAVKTSSDGSNGIQLLKNPTAIGMWVYGDNSKSWLRARVKDGKGESFDLDLTPDYRTDNQTGGINWTGWKYVEAQIPAGKEGPFILETPVRVMCTRDEMRTAGTIYIDRIRAVYGIKNDDTQAPVGNITEPVSQAALNIGKLSFKAEVSDNIGIDESSIRLYADGGLIEGLNLVNINGGIQVNASLGAEVPLADGLHNIVLKFADKFGNKTSKSVSVTVETGAPQVYASVPETAYAGESFNYSVSVKNPNTMKKIYMAVFYDKANLEVIDADPNTPGVQVALEGWVKKGQIINHKVDTQTGMILVEAAGLNAAANESRIKAFDVAFRIKSAAVSETRISLGTGAMIAGQNKAGSRFSLPPSIIGIGYGMQLSAEGFSFGDTTTITVTDRDGNPVEGAGIHFNGMEDFFLQTDKNGKVETKALTSIPIGTTASVQAIKNGIASNVFKFTIGEANTGLNPQALHFSFGDTTATIRFNYQTPVNQVGTEIQLMEKSAFNGTFSGSALSFIGTDSETILIDQGKLESVRSHTVQVTGIKPGIPYVYRFKDAAGKTSSIYEFISPKTSEGYSVLFLTDPQATDSASYAVYGDTLEKAASKAVNPTFAVITGDMVDRGNNKTQWDLFFKYSSRIFSRIPVMMIPGNHEKYDDEKLNNYKGYLGLPENGPEGFAEEAYSFETSDALFMTINTQEPLKSQLEWLEKKALASTKKWKVVLMHRSIYAGFYDESELRKAIAPVFDRAGIDLVLGGHDHTYLRTTMKAGVKTSPGSGTTYIAGGSSARKYYEAQNRSWTEVLYDTNLPVYTILKFQSDRITVISSHVENGKSIEHDRFDISKNK